MNFIKCKSLKDTMDKNYLFKGKYPLYLHETD